MQKISVTAQLAAYAASMLLGLGTFGAWNYFSVPDIPRSTEIPVINLANLDLGIDITASGVAHASTVNPFGDISAISNAGAGIAATGMGVPQGITPPTPPGVPNMPAEMQGGEVIVLGVLPPDVVIISRGGKSITARSGESTEFGTIGVVSIKGAYIDGAFVELH